MKRNLLILVILLTLIVFIGNNKSSRADIIRSNQEKEVVLFVRNDGTEIRKFAGTKYDTVRKINQGKKLIKLKEKNDWYLVRLPDGDMGWVHNTQVTENLNIIWDSLISKLNSNNPEIQMKAIEILYWPGNERAVKPLLLVLEDKKINKEVRNAAIIVLGYLEDKRATKPLIALLKERDWWVRRNTIIALGYLGDERGIDPLSSAIAELKGKEDRESLRLRAAAIQALGNIGTKGAISELHKMLESEDKRLRDDVITVLQRIRDKETVPVIIKRLKELLKEEPGIGIGQTYAKMDAIEALAEIRDNRAVEVLIEALKDRDGYVAREAAQALGTIGDKRGVEPLIEALQSKEMRYGYDYKIRVKAAEALAKIGDKKAIIPLIKALNDKYSEVRHTAAQSLGKIGDKQAITPLIPLLQDKNRWVRKETVIALGKIGDKRVKKSLIKALNDEDSEIRKETVKALKKITNKDYSHKISFRVKTENFADLSIDKIRLFPLCEEYGRVPEFGFSAAIEIVNNGNRSFKDIEVLLYVKSEDRKFRAQWCFQIQTVPLLNPGQNVTVEFINLRGTHPSTRQYLVVEIEPQLEEQNLDNNTKQIEFVTHFTHPD